MRAVDLAAQISTVRFTPRYTGGYDMGQVDQLLDRLERGALRGDDLDDLITRTELDLVRWRAAYDRKDVDRFLSEIAAVTVTEPAPDPVPSGGGSSTTAYGDLVEAISTARFTPVRLHEGYDMGQVDGLLDRIIAALGRGDSVTGVIDGARTNRVRLREGYDIAEVDRFLADVRRAAAPTAPAAGSAPPFPSVIQEQHSLLARLLGKL